MIASMPRLYVSDAIAQERLANGLSGSSAGSWGWKMLSALYQSSFAACGYRICPVVRPEIYQADVARKIVGVEAGDWHLAVKPIEHLRPFHGLFNAFVCDWPFPELAMGPHGDSPFYDQLRLLSVAEVIFCCTEFTTQTLRRAGIDKAITLPPVIESQTPGERLHSRRSAFLSVVEQCHLTRQLGHVIEGFGLAARQDQGLRLTICLQGGDAQSLSDLRQRVAQTGAGLGLALEETIVVINAGENAADLIWDSAEFFLCGDAAPGLCLPLAKAMLAGIPLVTTMTAGTASFLTAEAAVAIATEPQNPGAADEPIARFLDLTCHPPTASAVRDAVLTAAALDVGARAHLARTAKGIGQTKFGRVAFQSGLQRMSSVIALDVP